ncbi:MAG TPA: thioesterase family protein [Acidimicrobiales bacterium]|nr:thioesterase family protein [Acidimicrobiales bacterium]
MTNSPTDSPTDSRFDRDTALIPLGDGRFAGTIDPGWWIERGPNGGYIAAIVLRGLALAVEDPARTPRSLTVHYLAPPAAGPCEMHTRVERAGRRVTFVTGRLVQGDRLLALAMGAFAVSMEGPAFADISMPESLPLDEAELLPLMQTSSGAVSPMRARYEQRWAIGGRPFTSSPVAVVGGYIRFAEESRRPIDHLAVTAFSDAWIPSVFVRFPQPMGIPTVDLTVHFRAPLPHHTMCDDDFCLVAFRTQVAAEGFTEEDGEVWSPDGVLLAHSRQLAALIPD